jgi:hypothetical protein
LAQAGAKVESARAALAAADQRVKELSGRVKTAKGQVRLLLGATTNTTGMQAGWLLQPCWFVQQQSSNVQGGGLSISCSALQAQTKNILAAQEHEAATGD